jgi:hypothetical protein
MITVPYALFVAAPQQYIDMAHKQKVVVLTEMQMYCMLSSIAQPDVMKNRLPRIELTLNNCETILREVLNGETYLLERQGMPIPVVLSSIGDLRQAREIPE